MTGPEHYRAAEWLLSQQDGGADTIQQAMTHAVLAVAAATALAGSPDAGTEAWLEAMRSPERASHPLVDFLLSTKRPDKEPGQA